MSVLIPSCVHVMVHRFKLTSNFRKATRSKNGGFRFGILGSRIKPFLISGFCDGKWVYFYFNDLWADDKKIYFIMALKANTLKVDI